MNYFSNLIKNVDKVIIAVVVLLATVSLLIITSAHISSGEVNREMIVQAAAYIIGPVSYTHLVRMRQYQR